MPFPWTQQAHLLAFFSLYFSCQGQSKKAAIIIFKNDLIWLDLALNRQLTAIKADALAIRPLRRYKFVATHGFDLKKNHLQHLKIPSSSKKNTAQNISLGPF